MSGTTWPNLIAGTPARAADVEAKFDWVEGNVVPMLAGTGVDNNYDLGTTLLRWRAVYNVRNFLGDGSAVSPSLTFQSDVGNDTGWFLKGANAIGITTAGTERGQWDANGNFVLGTAAIATGATDGFIYCPGCAGTPTGTPSTYAGRVPLVFDNINNLGYFYSSGGWHQMGAAIGAKAIIQTSTASNLTSTAFSFGGQGRIRHMFTSALSAGGSLSGNLQLIIDGVTVLNKANIPGTTTANTHTNRVIKTAIWSSTAATIFETTITSNSVFQDSSDSFLDAYFKSSVTCYFRSATITVTFTVVFEYESA